MHPWKQLGLALLAGTVAGVLVLGVGGRLAMRALAWAAGQPPEFSVAGSLEVLTAGAWRGAVGGVLYFALARILRNPGVGRGLALGIFLYGFTLATLRSEIRGIASALDLVAWSVLLFGAIFLLYGLSLELALGRVGAPARSEG